MEVGDQIKVFQEFIEKNYYAQLLEVVRKGDNFLVMDFFELTKFNPELAEELLEAPEEVLKAGELAIKEFDLPKKLEKFYIRFRNLPESQKILISEIRSKHLGKFLWLEGTVRQKSDVRPHVMAAKFECPSCGNILTVVQTENKFREPSRCGCGRKGKFKELSKDLVDAQGLVLEEASEDLEGGAQPKRMNVFLKNDLVSPMTEKKTSPGNKVRVVGWVSEVPINLKSGGKSTKFDLIIEADHVEAVQEDFSSLVITDEEIKEIEELSRDPKIYEKLVSSIAPSIYGYDKVKEALVLQLVGGARKERADGFITRGDMHVLLIGDPGAGKSQLLKRIHKVAPKGRYISGKGVSGAGLCIAPTSIILTNPGGMETIEQIVEKRLKTVEEFRPGVWRENNIKDIKIQSLSTDLKLHSKHPSHIWKLKAPEMVYEIILQSGKKVELTGNTQLFFLNNGQTEWKKAKDIREGETIATPRKLIGGDNEKYPFIDLVGANPVIHEVKHFVKEVAEKLKEKYGSLRECAKKLKIKENQLYYHWVNEGARGNIKRADLKKIAEEAGINWKDKINKISLYNGKVHTLPKYLNKQVLYLAGLIAGDGDLRKINSKSYSIRLSNSCETLHEIFKKIIKSEFNLHCGVTESSDKRPKATRTHSRVLGESLISLGIPISPKSNKIYIPNILLNLSNNLLAEYIAGLYDTDGSVSIRKGKGSNCIDLTTCSEKLARQIQLVLLRYEIHASIRRREPSDGKIKGNYAKWIVEIRNKSDIEKFAINIPLKHSEKKNKLNNLIVSIKNKPYHTNIDILPGVGKILKEILQKNNISLKKVKWHNNLSVMGLKEILSRIKIKNKDIKKLSKIAESDIYWENVTEINRKMPDYEYVYDLTVKNSHNFVVDGVLVHNTAAVVRDEFLGGWSLEAGALVLANKGFCMIDELDKMSKEDTSAMHEALEGQTVSISKANIQATLRAETTVLAAANPKFGRFDPYGLVMDQIDLPPTLINRFDLIFAIKDLPSKEKDEHMATHILTLHQRPDEIKGEIDTKLLKKYIAYARQKIKPEIGEGAIDEIKEFYINMRNTGQGEAGVKSIPITARQLEALIRLAEASAKTRLSDKVTQKDAKRAIELIKFCLNQVARDPETGVIDIDRISSGIPAKERSKISIIREIVDVLEGEFGKTIPIENIIERAEAKGLKAEEIEEIIEKLRRTGDLFEPRRGFIQKL